MDVGVEADDSRLPDRSGAADVGCQRLRQAGKVRLGHHRRSGVDVGECPGCLVLATGRESWSARAKQTRSRRRGPETTLTTVPAFASLHEVAIATWETAAAQTATIHHQVGALTAMNTAAASTSVAASSHSTPPRAPTGALSRRDLRPTEALGHPEEVDEPMTHQHSDDNPADHDGHT